MAKKEANIPVLIAFPDDMLKRMDDLATHRGLSRAAFVRNAVSRMCDETTKSTKGR